MKKIKGSEQRDALRLNPKSEGLFGARLTSPQDLYSGYSYFGTRYYDSDLSGLFLSVDPMSDKYPSISPYAYCVWNSLKLVDPDGRDIHIVGDEQYRAQVYSLLNKLAKSGLAGKYLVYHALKDKPKSVIRTTFQSVSFF